MSSSGRARWVRSLSLVIRIAAGIFVLLIGLLILIALEATKPTTEQSELTESEAIVRVVELSPVPVDRWWQGYGTARAIRDADLAAEVSGQIAEKPDSIEPGARVKRGDLLVRIEARDYEDGMAGVDQSIASLQAQLAGLDVEEESLNTSIQLAERSVRLLRSELDEIREARTRGGATTIEVERVERQLAAAERDEQSVRERLQLIPSRRLALQANLTGLQSDRRRAQADLERTTIKAPFGGFVQRIDVEEGEYVMPGASVARLVDLARLEIPLRLPVTAADTVTIGGRVDLSARGGSGRWTGQVVRVAPEADPELRTLEVFVEVEQNPDGSEGALLRPGQFVTGRIYTLRDAAQLVVPRISLLNDRVMVVNGEGRAESREITISHFVDERFPSLDPIETQWAVVSAGLHEGDRVIASHAESIEHGMRVRVQSASDDTSSASRNGSGSAS